MKKMKQYRNDEAVSPVIGVILMVAITVILAAVIAAFVFGMAGNVSKTKNVAYTAQKGALNMVTITNNGGQDVGTLKADGVLITVNTNTLGPYSNMSGTGNSTLVQGSATKDHIILTGTFNDGTSAVLLDTYV